MGIKDWFGGDKKKAAFREKVKEAVSDGKLDAARPEGAREDAQGARRRRAGDDRTVMRREIYNEAVAAAKKDGEITGTDAHELAKIQKFLALRDDQVEKTKWDLARLRTLTEIRHGNLPYGAVEQLGAARRAARARRDRALQHVGGGVRPAHDAPERRRARWSGAALRAGHGQDARAARRTAPSPRATRASSSPTGASSSRPRTARSPRSATARRRRSSSTATACASSAPWATRCCASSRSRRIPVEIVGELLARADDARTTPASCARVPWLAWAAPCSLAAMSPGSGPRASGRSARRS